MKPFRLTTKEISRADSGVVIVSRKQARGGYLVVAVRVTGQQGTPLLSPVFQEIALTREGVPAAAKEVARWLSKMGVVSKMADASRSRRKGV